MTDVYKKLAQEAMRKPTNSTETPRVVGFAPELADPYGAKEEDSFLELLEKEILKSKKALRQNSDRMTMEDRAALQGRVMGLDWAYRLYESREA